VSVPVVVGEDHKVITEEEFQTKLKNEDYNFSWYIFPEDINFSDMTFEKKVDFSNAVFEGETFFNNTIFKGQTFFYKTIFKKKIDFSDARFKASTEFIETIFEPTAYFTNTNFESNVLFDKSEFKNGANFYETTFHEDAHFKEVTFYNENAKFSARFIGAHFKKSANFENAIFGVRALFSNAIFEQAVSFNRTPNKEHNFQDDAIFNYATFRGYTNFENAIFDDTVGFEHATFQVGAFFEGAKFLDSCTRFNYAEFYGDVYFDKAEFNEIDGYTRFDHATFGEETYFRETKFLGEVYFSDTNFTGVTDFDFAEFKGEKTWFYPTFFENDVYFNNTYLGDNPEDLIIFKFKFEKNTIFEFDPIINCKLDIKEFSVSGLAKIHLKGLKLDNIDVIIVVFGHVELLGADLTDTKFKDAYLENINFVKCKWPDPFIIYEETHKDDRGIDLDYEGLEIIYRNLKISFQKHGQSDYAGKAFYREMEMKRLGAEEKGDTVEKWKLCAFKYLCGYGERPENIVFWFFVAIFGFAGLFYKSRINVEDHPYLYFRDKVEYAKFCILFSIASFTTLGSTYIKPKGKWSRRGSTIESAIGAFFIALFIYVFVRKMLR